MTYAQIMDELPLAVGLQFRNIALSEGGVRIIPPGRVAGRKAAEILGEHAAEWME